MKRQFFFRNAQRTVLILALLCFLFGGGYPLRACGENENLLFNGNFDLINAEGLPEGWYTDAYFKDDGYTEFSSFEITDGSGNYAARIRNIAANDARFAQDVAVEPETIYCLSGYILAEDVQDGRGCNLSIEGVYAFSESLYETGSQWRYVEYYGQTGSDQNTLTVFARVGGYSGESTGVGSFDQLSLTKADELPDGILADPWFRISSSESGEDDEDDSE